MSISIKVIKDERLKAITILSQSILNLTKALNENVIVNINNVEVNNCDVGVSVTSETDKYDIDEYEYNEMSENEN